MKTLSDFKSKLARKRVGLDVVVFDAHLQIFRNSEGVEPAVDQRPVLSVLGLINLPTVAK